ncbi:glycosyltransferase family 2 protein [Sediminicola sp. 1XM1-17]|uniref:glycosyltransferase family 2 protein n=1 Tax=Sediminicola sp. 1XM1-17 TaxID=3127702 RepID=UPI003076B74C
MLFSIGIPAFKKSFLKECIDSILNQTFLDFELIIVNDNSPEDLESIISLYDDKRIRYYKNSRNFGAENVIDNWNKCLSYAKGEYFLLMGDDDRLEPNYLEEFSILTKKSPELDVLHCQSYIINEKGEKIGLTAAWPQYETIYENIWHRVLGLRQQYISDFVYKTKSLIARKGFYKLPLAWASDDISSFIAIGDKGIAHINKPLFNYRKNMYTISSSGNVKLKMEAILLEKKWFEDFLIKIPKNQKDSLIHEYLKNNISDYIKQKKIAIITQSFTINFIYHLPFWVVNKSNYQINLMEINLGLFRFVKNSIHRLLIR